MFKSRLFFVCLVVLSIVSPVVAWDRAEAAGPWKGQIVDAETGKPLEGVVVLAVWYRRYASVGGWAGGGYYDSEEVVTGPDGHFVIQSRWTFTVLPFITTIKGPHFLIFKSGYGLWRFQGFEKWGKDPIERAEHLDRLWEQFEDDGVVIELPPLQTWKDRRKSLSDATPTGEIPYSEIPTYLAAINRERASLGLSPLGREEQSREER